MTAIALPRSDQYYVNERRFPAHTDALPCVVCGRAIKDSTKAKQLHIGYGGGMVISEDDPGVGSDGDMDFFPVGADCLRKYPELRRFTS